PPACPCPLPPALARPARPAGSPASLAPQAPAQQPPARLPPPAASSAWHCSPLASQPGSAPCHPPHHGTGTPPHRLPRQHPCLPHAMGNPRASVSPQTSCAPTSQAFPP
ncbi:PREDICTED: vegetative cell wall protein gp1, partial [Nipponia nippon]|uniref:vegetative cell wall protein gp1 n=1 Tax=Nipponia nippon TaxID=128390 RepID=UPI000510FDF4